MLCLTQIDVALIVQCFIQNKTVARRNGLIWLNNDVCLSC